MMRRLLPKLYQIGLAPVLTLGALFTVLWTANNAGAIFSLLRLFAAPLPVMIHSQGVAQAGGAPFHAKGERS
ncbi:MAG: hypothetical protein U0401_08290 [Anaerolineae bacterium]